jgi:hypothetical protein
VRDKVDEYLRQGVPVVAVDPEARTVAVSCQSKPVQVLGSEDVLDLGDVIPGFRCEVHRIFE